MPVSVWWAFLKRFRVHAQASAASKPNERLPLGVSLSLSSYIFPFWNTDNYEPAKSRQQRTDALSSFIRPRRNGLCQSIPTDHISQRAERWLLSKAALPLPTMWIEKLHSYISPPAGYRFYSEWVIKENVNICHIQQQYASYFQNLYLLNTPAPSRFHLLAQRAFFFYSCVFHNS